MRSETTLTKKNATNSRHVLHPQIGTETPSKINIKSKRWKYLSYRTHGPTWHNQECVHAWDGSHGTCASSSLVHDTNHVTHCLQKKNIVLTCRAQLDQNLDVGSTSHGWNREGGWGGGRKLPFPWMPHPQPQTIHFDSFFFVGCHSRLWLVEIEFTPPILSCNLITLPCPQYLKPPNSLHTKNAKMMHWQRKFEQCKRREKKAPRMEVT